MIKNWKFELDVMEAKASRCKTIFCRVKYVAAVYFWLLIPVVLVVSIGFILLWI